MNSGNAITTPHHLSTEAGVAAYRAGGNALDAALAAAASLTVTLPDNCALGGDLIALVREPVGREIVVNASGWSAAAVDVDAHRSSGRAMPAFGPHAVTVPGALRGWEALAGLGIELDRESLLEPAIAQAADGVPVARSVERALEREQERLSGDPGMRRIFFANGRALLRGETLVQPELAESLSTIASDGADAFYRGDLGRTWLRTLKGLGSVMAEDDLAEYQAEVTGPIRLRQAGEEVLTAPPNSQGLMLLATLEALGADAESWDPLGYDAARLAEAFRRASELRDRYLADPRFAAVSVEAVLNEATASAASKPGAGSDGGRPHGDTVAVLAADASGRAVSLIQSLFDSFGSGILDPATGILAHNRGTFFSLDPSSPNVLTARKRPAHTLTPAMVLEDGELRYVLGTMGGLAQTQILTQLLLHLRTGFSADEAVAAPRWTVGGIEAHSDQARAYAERRVPKAAVEALELAGSVVVELPDLASEVGEAQVIVRDAGGRYHAACDPRSEGAAASGGRTDPA
jgi:gamma-glutamyltranspeptidase/glutathione hydrolase